MAGDGQPGPLPVTVVVPVREEGRTIDALLASLKAQGRQPAEIVVVDAGSADDTAERVRRWMADWPRLRLLSIGPAFPGEARNAGIEAAAWDWIALTDAGIRLEPDWLHELWRAHEENGEAEVVFGHYEPELRGWLSECAALTYLPPCEELGGRWWRGNSFVSALLHRNLWRRCGGFPPFRSAEDLVFLEAIARDGCRRAAAPAARVRWELPAGLGATFRRFATYSRHTLIAGRGRYWHRGVVRLYAAATLLAAAGWLVSPAIWLLLPTGVVMRAVRAVAVRAPGSRVHRPWRPDRLAGVILLQVLLDAATAWGSWVWLRRDAAGAG